MHIPGYIPWALDKEALTHDYVSYWLNRTQGIFKWSSLPDTIPERELEYILQCFGACAVTKVNNKLYALRGSLGGEPDAYYRPTIITVANPYLRYDAQLRIGVDCVLARGDSIMRGILPLLSKYAALMAENDITFKITSILARSTKILSAGDDRTKAAAELYLKQIERGELGVIGNSLLDTLGINSASTDSTARFTDLIEAQQYLKASLYNELGLQANYNMKRESINSNEAQLNEDALIPLIDDMLKCRQEAAEAINKMYDTEIKVEYSSVWRENEIERLLELEAMGEQSIDLPADNGGEDMTKEEAREVLNEFAQTLKTMFEDKRGAEKEDDSLTENEDEESN